MEILEKVIFKELKELYLSRDKISDINILEKVNFKKLNILYLRMNEISDINTESASFIIIPLRMIMLFITKNITLIF